MSDLAALFSIDPQQYTERNLDDIIEELRKRRHQFNAGNMKAGSTKPKTEKQKATLAIAEHLKLGNLDL